MGNHRGRTLRVPGARPTGVPFAGLGCLVAVIVVFLGWMTRYPDQVPGMWRFITSVDPFEGW